MIKPIIKSFTKITILTLVFFVFFYVGGKVINAWWWDSEEKTENKDIFTSIDNYGLSEVGVALNINVGTKFYEGKQDSESKTFYNEVISIATIKSDKNKTNNELITKNINAIRDYLNITKINIKGYLDSSDDRKDNYESLMNQYKIRYKIGYANSKNLSIQVDSITSHLQQLEISIENIKESMKTNLKNYNAKGLNKNIDDYLTIKNESTLMKVYLIFCNRFLAYYNFLNDYNKNIITTLRLNQDAIIKNTYVVVPSSGSDLIKNLNLIYDESEIQESEESSNNTNKTDSESVETNSNSNSNSDSSSINYNSNYNFDTDYSVNSINSDGIFGDPFNLKDGNIDTIKQTGKIDFGSSKYTDN